MRRKFKRLAALIMSAAMILPFFTEYPEGTFDIGFDSDWSVSAAEALIDDTTGVTLSDSDNDGYYDIGTADALYAFANIVNSGNATVNAKLTQDINMTDVNWTVMSGYAGTFDGNGFTILNLCADESGGDDDIANGSRCGLFQTLSEGGTVTNLTISGAQLWSANSAGAIAAVNNGTISKCIVKDSTIELGASHGLSAIAGTNTGTVTDCGVVNCFLRRRWGAANSGDYAIGVIVEDNSGTVSNCFSYGCTFSNSPNLFAIVESGNAPVNCYYYTTATVSDKVANKMTADQFASGEVTYLLNDSQSEDVVWYQTIRNDIFPILNNNHKKVFMVFKCDGTTVAYHNYNGNYPHTDDDNDNYCDECNKYSSVAINETNFPDAIFRIYVNENFDTTDDELLTAQEISKISEINVNKTFETPDEEKIASLKGIEYFSNLIKLELAHNKVTELDVSKNPKLYYLYCNMNNLTEVNLEKNTELGYLYFQSNQLSSLDLSKNTKLQVLYSSRNQLTSIKVENCKSLRTLDVYMNCLENIDVSNNTKLTDLSCSDNKLTSLDVVKNTQLIELSCDKNELTNLNIEKNTQLEYLSCSNNKFTDLDISNNTKLTKLFCAQLGLTTLDISNNPELIWLSCGNNDLTTLDLTKHAKLENLLCYNNPLIAVNAVTDISSNYFATPMKTFTTDNGTINLEDYGIDYNRMSDLTGCTLSDDNQFLLPTTDESTASYIYDIDGTVGEHTITVSISFGTGNVNINEKNFPDAVFRAYVNEKFDTTDDDILTTDELIAVTKIDVKDMEISDLTGIEYFMNLSILNCDNNNLEKIDVGKNTNLTEFSCYNNSLSELNVLNNKKLERLECGKNNLKSINIENNKKLFSFGCSYNDISELELKNNIELQYLSCSYTNLANLDVRHNTKLNSLWCIENNLNELNLENNKELEILNLDSNNLQILDVSVNTKLRQLGCSFNCLTSLDLSNNSLLTENSFDCRVNKYPTVVDSTFDLSMMPEGFDINKTSNWKNVETDADNNPVIKDNKIKLLNYTNPVYYTYDCGNNLTAEFLLVPYSCMFTEESITIRPHTYTGEAINPIVECNGFVLGENIDYTIECENNINAGTATATIKAIGDFYKGEVTVEWTIEKKIIETLSIYVMPPKPNEIPQTTLASGEGYTAEIEWTPADEKFKYNEEYTATVVVTPESNYKFSEATTGKSYIIVVSPDINPDNIEDLITGTTVIYNDDGTLTLKKAYKTTAKAKITSLTPPENVVLTDHCADSDAVIEKLPKTVEIVAEDGTELLDIEWTFEGGFDTVANKTNTFKWTANVGDLDADGIAVSGEITVTNPDYTDVSDDITLTVEDIIYGEKVNVTASYGTENVVLTYSDDGETFADIEELLADGLLPVGDYTVKAYFEDNTKKGTATAEFKVTKASPTVNPVVNDEDLTEGDELPEISLSEDDTAGTIKWITEGVLELGENVLEWMFTPENDNYSAVTGTAVVNAKETTTTTTTTTTSETTTSKANTTTVTTTKATVTSTTATSVSVTQTSVSFTTTIGVTTPVLTTSASATTSVGETSKATTSTTVSVTSVSATETSVSETTTIGVTTPKLTTSESVTTSKITETSKATTSTTVSVTSISATETSVSETTTIGVTTPKLTTSESVTTSKTTETSKSTTSTTVSVTSISVTETSVSETTTIGVTTPKLTTSESVTTSKTTETSKATTSTTVSVTSISATETSVSGTTSTIVTTKVTTTSKITTSTDQTTTKATTTSKITITSASRTTQILNSTSVTSSSTVLATVLSIDVSSVNDGKNQWYYADEKQWHTDEIAVYLNGEIVESPELTFNIESPEKAYNSKEFNYTITVSCEIDDMKAQATFDAKIGLRGDANCDHKVSVRDAAIIARDLAQIFTTKETLLADENGFGVFLANVDYVYGSEAGTNGIVTEGKETEYYGFFNLNIRDAATIARWLAAGYVERV